MNPEAQKVLKAILAKDVSELTEYDKSFLKARWNYVGKNSRQKFASILTEKSKKPKAPKPETPKEKTLEGESKSEDEDETETGTDEDFSNEE